METKFRVYACGGTGINQVALCKDESVKNAAVYVDCSRSDSAQHGIDDVFIFSNVMAQDDENDGSGKVRNANLEIIAPQMPKFLKENPPGDYNVIVSSDSGGTGPIINHLLVEQLVKLGLPFIIMLTGSQSSLIECSNGVKALNGFNNIGLNNEVAVPLVYHNNNRTNATSTGNDKSVADILTQLSMLFSNDYYRLDTQDKQNLLMPTNVTNFDGGLIELYCRTGELDQKDGSNTILSILTLADTLDAAPSLVSAEYFAFGEDANIKEPIHYILGVENIVNIVNFVIEAEEKKLEEANARSNLTKGLFAKSKLKPKSSGSSIII